MKGYTEDGTGLILSEAELREMQREAHAVVKYYSKGVDLICTKCQCPIATYHRTKNGPHHLKCPSEELCAMQENDPFDFLICLNCQTRWENVQRDHPEVWAASQRATAEAPLRCPKCTTGLDFGQALAAMRAGKRVRRSEWVANDELSLWVAILKHPEDGELQVWAVDGELKIEWEEWMHPARDILAVDWEVCE